MNKQSAAVESIPHFHFSMVVVVVVVVVVGLFTKQSFCFSSGAFHRSFSTHGWQEGASNFSL
jgi:hypothetical protein